MEATGHRGSPGLLAEKPQNIKDENGGRLEEGDFKRVVAIEREVCSCS